MLANKSVLITGSTSGIGLAIAHAFAKEGCHIMLNGFADPAQITAIKSDFKPYKSKIEYSPADLSIPDQAEQLVLETVKQFGGLDILVNNAGIQFTSPIDQFPEEKWDSVLAINLSAAFHTTKHVLPAMRRNKFGRIINIASAHGLVASPQKAAYVAAKHGLMGLTKVTALETAQENITCNGICPGWVLTPLVQKQIDDKAKTENKSNDQAAYDLLHQKQPSHKFVKPEDIAAMAVFLCGPHSASITGAAISIDGGWTAQ